VLDEAIPLSDLWGRSAVELGERLAATSGPVQALDLLQRVIATASRAVDPPDPVVAGAIARLLPGGTVEVGEVARSLAISRSQLRRRCLHALGIGPKTLQRTLRFQRYLALAQAASQDALRLGDRRTASLAAVAGYADQPHLVRECGRLAGVTPSALLGLDDDRCGCGHDHTASFRSFLAPGLLARHRPPVEHLRHSFKRDPVNAS
jgi:AraC-like DNA-binding protein